MAEHHDIAATHSRKHKPLFSDRMNYLNQVGARMPKQNPEYDPKAYKAAKEYELRLMWGPFEGDRTPEDDEMPQPE